MSKTNKGTKITDCDVEEKKGEQYFKKLFPNSVKGEYEAFIKDTANSQGDTSANVVDKMLEAKWEKELFNFVVQVGYADDGSINIDGRQQMDKCLEEAGFTWVESSGSRTAFDYKEGSWEKFQSVVAEKSKELKIPIKRVLFCFSSMGLVFNYAEDKPP